MRSRSHFDLNRTLVTTFVTSLATSALAGGPEMINWNNTFFGSWSNASNWNPMDVPNGFTESAVFNTGSASDYFVDFDLDTEIWSLHVMEPTTYLSILSGRFLSVRGGTLENHGSIEVLNGSSNGLWATGNLLISGAGSIRLYDEFDAQIGSSDNRMVTHAAGHTIAGRGIISARFDNAGVIDADSASGGLRITQGSGEFRNLPGGVMKASGNGTLRLESGIVRSGTLMTSESGVITGGGGGGALLRGVTIAPGARVSLPNNVDLTIANDELGLRGMAALINDGVISVHPGTGTSVSYLGAAEDSVIESPSGDGHIRMQSEFYASIFTHPGVTLTNGPSHSILGFGFIEAQLINEGLIDADVPGLRLRIVQGNGDVDNTNGTLSASDGILALEGGSVIGGSMTTAGQGFITGGAVGSIIRGCTLEPGSLMALRNNEDIRIGQEGFVNRGSVRIHSGSGTSNSVLIPIEDCIISGDGEIRLENEFYAYLSPNPNITVTNALGHTINGYGLVAGGLINNGLIDADIPGLRLRIVQGNGDIDNTNGVMSASNGLLALEGGSVIGGSLMTSGQGAITGGPTGAILRGPTLEAGSVMALRNNEDIRIGQEGLVNHGSVRIHSGSGSNASFLIPLEDCTVSGSGEVRLENEFYAYLYPEPGITLTNDTSHTINGYGIIAGGMINNGMIDADIPGLRLRVVQGNGDIDNTNGIMGASDGILAFEAGRVTGGSLTTGDQGVIAGGQPGTILEGVTIMPDTRVDVRSNETLNIEGPIINDGFITIKPPSGSNASVLNATADASLLGSGRAYMASSFYSWLGAGTEGATLTNGPDHTVVGSGNLYGQFVNEGMLSPSTNLISQLVGSMTFDGDFVQTSSGTMRMDLASISNFDRILSNSGDMDLGGLLDIHLVDLFDPQVGQRFRVIQSSTPIGANRFGIAAFPVLGGDRYMRLEYDDQTRGTPGSVTIVVDSLLRSVELLNPQSFAVSGTPKTATLADLNRDGELDLAVVLPDPDNPETMPGQLVVFYNNGNSGGAWLGFSAGVNVPTGPNPVGIKAGSFDGASGDDLAVINAGDSTLQIFLNNGSGVPMSTATLATPLQPRDLVIVDMDGNGVQDIVVSAANSGDGRLSTRLNEGGTGAGWNGFMPEITFPVGGDPVAIDIGDLDNDKDRTPDVAIADAASDTVILLENLGDLGGPWLGLSSVATFPVGTGPVDLEMGDFNGDDRPDVMIASEADDSVSVVLNRGLLEFDPPVSVPVPEGPRSLTTLDVEADGDLDAAVIVDDPFLGQRVVSVIRNDYDPMTGQLAFVVTEQLGVGTDPLLVLSGNIDGLVGDDILTLNDESLVRGITDEQDVSVYLNANGLCVGDTNADDAIDFADLNQLLDDWNATVPPLTGGDVNGDGLVNFADLNLLLDQWGVICP